MSEQSILGTSLDAAHDKAEPLLLAESLMASTAAALAPIHVGDTVFSVLPPGFRRDDITDAVEKAQTLRNRPQGTVHLGDVGSLLTYCTDQVAQNQGYIYADPDARTITAVFNDQKSTLAPGWRDHRAVFKAEYTPEFSKWLNKNGPGNSMGQTEFAEFIEDNFADLAGDDAKNLLTVATTIQAASGINFSSAKRLQNGQTQLTYNETIDAKAGTDGALQIPQTFNLGLRIFKNGGGYKLIARLKYRLHSGGVKFWYELDRPERAVEDAFTGYVQEVRDKSGYTVLIGKA